MVLTTNYLRSLIMQIHRKSGDCMMENEKFQELLLEQFAKLYQDIQEVKSGQQRTEERVSSLDSKADKLGVLMEKVDNNIKAVAEGLSTHREQNDRQFDELKSFIKEENELLKSVLKHSISEIWEPKRVGGNVT